MAGKRTFSVKLSMRVLFDVLRMPILKKDGRNMMMAVTLKSNTEKMRG